MGLSWVQSRALLGLEAAAVTVEVHLANGLPSFTLVGLADVEVKEARERVRSAILNAGLEFPHNKKITVNLAPADLPKDSGRFDLPIAVGILAASGQVDAGRLSGHEFAGELSLSGAEGPHIAMLQMCCANAFNCRSGAFAIMCAWTSRAATMWNSPERNKVFDACGKGERDVGADDGDGTGNRFAREVLDWFGAEDHFAACGRYGAAQCAHQRGLSGTVWSHDGDALPWSDAQ
jgi:hypothetical protein